MSAQWIYRLLADVLVLAHLTFAGFAVLGGFLALRWRRVAWIHLGAVIWAATIEFSGWICPLTPLEIWLRQRAGEAGYRSDFVAHYLLPVLYPEGLTRGAQIVLGVFVLVVNLAVYGWILLRNTKKKN